MIVRSDSSFWRDLLACGANVILTLRFFRDSDNSLVIRLLHVSHNCVGDTETPERFSHSGVISSIPNF